MNSLPVESSPHIRPIEVNSPQLFMSSNGLYYFLFTFGHELPTGLLPSHSQIRQSVYRKLQQLLRGEPLNPFKEESLWAAIRIARVAESYDLARKQLMPFIVKNHPVALLEDALAYAKFYIYKNGFQVKREYRNTFIKLSIGAIRLLQDTSMAAILEGDDGYTIDMSVHRKVLPNYVYPILEYYQLMCGFHANCLKQADYLWSTIVDKSVGNTISSWFNKYGHGSCEWIITSPPQSLYERLYKQELFKNRLERIVFYQDLSSSKREYTLVYNTAA